MIERTAVRTTALVVIAAFTLSGVAEASVFKTGGTPDEGKLPPVGTTVDMANATWTNSIGDAELIAVWKDIDFDPKKRAFYYARVLEIPTPRWTAYDAKRFGQERAYTSPIWYTPGG